MQFSREKNTLNAKTRKQYKIYIKKKNTSQVFSINPECNSEHVQIEKKKCVCENKNFDGKWHQWRDFKEKWKLMYLLLPLGAVSETEDAPKETANGFQFQEIIMQGEKKSISF